MSKFNGMSQVEIEMMRDEMEKVIPLVKGMIPQFAEVSAAYYNEFKKYPDLNDGERASLAVRSTAVKFGFGK